MAENQLFVASEALDRWVEKGQARLVGASLEIGDSGRRYAITEAMHVVAEVTGAGDPNGLVGRVWTVKDLSLLDAEVLGKALVLGESAYDGRPGFLMAPLGTPGEKVPTEAAVRMLSRLSGLAQSVQSDEELLARYLIDKLE
jgi:hypothetical protein